MGISKKISSFVCVWIVQKRIPNILGREIAPITPYIVFLGEILFANFCFPQYEPKNRPPASLHYEKWIPI